MGGAGQPRSWTAGHSQNGLYHPFVPTSGSLRLHIKAFSPHPGISWAGEPQRHSRCSRLSPNPAIQFVQVYEHPDEENENRSIEAEPLVWGKLNRGCGNEVGCYHLQADLGRGVTLNTGVCEKAELDKLTRTTNPHTFRSCSFPESL